MYRNLKSFKRVGVTDIGHRADMVNIIKKDPPKSIRLKRKHFVGDLGITEEIFKERGSDYLHDLILEHPRGRNPFTSKQSNTYASDEGLVNQNPIKIGVVRPKVKLLEDLEALSRLPRLKGAFTSVKYFDLKKITFKPTRKVKKLPRGYSKMSKLIIRDGMKYNKNINRDIHFNKIETSCIRPLAGNVTTRRDVRIKKNMIKKKHFNVESIFEEPINIWNPKNV